MLHGSIIAPHVECVSAITPVDKERTISLKCFIEASSRSAFVEWLNRFLALFDGDHTRLSLPPTLNV